MVVKNKTNRPFVATIRFKGYGENWDSVYEDPGECYVSLKAKGEQRVYFMASEEIEHIKLDVTGTDIHQVGNKSTKVDADLSLEVLDDYLRYQYVLTNEACHFGAVYMLFTDVMDQIVDRKGDDIYIIPSSIHETLVVAVSEVKNLSYLCDIVHDINEIQLPVEDRLSNHIYRYSKDDGLSIAA